MFNKFRSIYDSEALRERLSHIRHVALDMDGTIYMGQSLFPYTRPFLQSLREMGIREEHLDTIGICTACNGEQLYWSHRRNGEARGVQCALISLKEGKGS